MDFFLIKSLYIIFCSQQLRAVFMMCGILSMMCAFRRMDL